MAVFHLKEIIQIAVLLHMIEREVKIVDMMRPMYAICILLSLFLCNFASCKPIPDDCKEMWFEQRLDHFRWVRAFDQPTFQQRYFVCDAHWKRDAKGPIFFYGPDSWRQDPSYLTSEQAMADYATLLQNLTTAWKATDSPIIAFGGSYGGMLAAWMRRSYPHIIAGAVAASAPVGQFPGVQDFEPSRFWDVVTRDATQAGGAAPQCADNVRTAFKQIFELATTSEGRQQLQEAFMLCEPLDNEQDVTDMAYWIQGAFDAYAMGNYHFESDYMTSPGHNLPAWPMRAACKEITHVPSPSLPAPQQQSTPSQYATVDNTASVRRLLGWKSIGHEQGISHLTEATKQLSSAAGMSGVDTELLVKLRKAVALLYNVTGDASCFMLDIIGPGAATTGPWDYQVCTEFLGQELPYFPAGPDSMFWDQGAFNWDNVVQHCQQAWGITPTKYWSVVEHGGMNWRGTSNIVFSNGMLDPWSAFGVLANVSDSVVAVLIPDGAHHSDLMYSRPDDSAELTEARQAIMQHVARWINAHASAKAEM